MKSIEEIPVKHFIKQYVKELNVNKHIMLLYFEDDYVQFHTKIAILPKIGFIWGSTESLVDIYCGMYSVMKNKGIDLTPTPENIRITIKAIAAHEIGHMLDKGIKDNMIKSLCSTVDIGDYVESSGNSIEKFLNCRVIIHDENLNNRILNFKKLLVERESNAWQNAKEIMKFENSHEENMFNLLKEYCLATYNNHNLSSILNEYKGIKGNRNLAKMLRYIESQ